MSDDEVIRGGDLRPYPGSNWGKPPERPAPPLSRDDLERHFRLIEREAGMTDMRATERLLEVIEELATIRDGASYPTDYQLNHIREAVTELRRRGDTLVRAEDLRTITDAIRRPSGYLGADYAKQIENAIDRLEDALGSKP